MITEVDIRYLQQAVNLATASVQNGQGGPFGCLIVKHDQIIGKGSNQVTSSNDPTAHAEIVAIREACRHLDNYQLTDCILYTSCEPCPMCLGAIYWARPARVYYATNRFHAAAADFDDQFIYEELALPDTHRKIPFEFYHEERFLEPFALWKRSASKKLY